MGHAVEAVFRAWGAAGIDFLVLRNYDGLPEFTTNDIDVLIAPAQRPRAEQVLLRAAQEAGFQLVNRAEFATLALYLAQVKDDPSFGAGKAPRQLHFDLFTDLTWRGFHFLDCRGFLGRKVKHTLFSVPHPADEAATSLLAYLIYTGKVKEKYRAGITAEFRAEPGAVLDVLVPSYGAQARFLLEAASNRQWAEIESHVAALRRALVWRHLARPWGWLKDLAAHSARWARRAVQPPGLTIVLCGADGCGKSTVGRAVIEGLAGTFSPAKGAHFHWKPPLFSARRRAARGPVTAPQAQPPRGRVASLLFFGIHWLEFWLGSFVCFWPRRFRGGLVLVDRFYYDFFVDQKRYRLRMPLGCVRLGYWLLPKPDLVFLLDAPPAVLQARKQEVPLAETARQREAYLTLIRSLPNGRVIDATQPPERVAAQIQWAMLDFLATRTAKRVRSRN